MPGVWKTVRIFISSTFRDMHSERDHLVRFVFPDLKERARKKHLHVIDVDLRWGVTEEDAQAGKALDICLDEIDTCRPYFIGLLAHRYGYIPPGHRHSITAQEIHHGVLHGNIPTQVVDLRRILEETLEGRSLSGEQKSCLVRCFSWDAEKNKYLLTDDAAPDELEIIRSVFEKYSIYQRDRSFFFFRTEALSRKLTGTSESDFFEQAQENQQKLAALKKEIVDGGLPCFDYGDMETFGQQVLEVLWRRIETEAEASVEEKDWLQRERELQELFMADRTRRFVGRRDLLDRMHAFCAKDEDPRLLLITGEPGCGKSALMARFVEEVMHAHPDWLIIPHFVGASSASTNLRQMLRRVCAQLRRAIGSDEAPPEDIKELLKIFPDLLLKAGKKQRVVFLLDAVNQLEKSDQSQRMQWLPDQLPERVRFVISTLVGEARDALMAGRITPQEETVKGLTPPEIKDLVQAYLLEIRHEFPKKDVEDTFYNKVKGGNPLYILIALEELRVFGKFEELGNRINGLPDSVPALFDQVLERVENDLHPALVRDCMIYIACGRHGMAAEELQTLLKMHARRADPASPKLPDMLWTRLYRSFSSYLFERSDVIDFFHGQLKEAVGHRYLHNETDRDAAHKTIAGYFENRWKEPYTRALDELPHQHTKGKDWEGLERVLCDLAFIEAKCTAGMTYELVADYSSALASMGIAAERSSAIEDFARFTGSQRHILHGSPALAFQQAANQPDSTPVEKAAKYRLETKLETRPWLRRLDKAQISSSCLAVFEGHRSAVRACAFSPDGRWIASASDDGTLKLWDSTSGRDLATLTGHSREVTDCAFSPDGTRIVSTSSDKTLKLWDAITGREVASLSSEGFVFSPDGSRIASLGNPLRLWDTKTGKEVANLQDQRIFGVRAFSPDGNGIVTGSDDHALRLWDTNTIRVVAILKGHEKAVRDCAFSPDGSRIASASEDATVKLWDPKTGEIVATLVGRSSSVGFVFSPAGNRILFKPGNGTLKICDTRTGREVASILHPEFVFRLDFSPDGNRIVSSCNKKVIGASIEYRSPLDLTPGYQWMLKIWDPETGQEIAKLEHFSAPRFVFSPDGSRIASYITFWKDKTLRLWDTKTGNALDSLVGHSSLIHDCAFSPDGTRVVSASHDMTVRLWNGGGGPQFAAAEGHSNDVLVCTFSPDGNLVLSASHDETLKLWHGKTGKELATLVGHSGPVYACDFSPDGSHIVSASYDTTLKLWETGFSEEVASLIGHSYEVRACRFSPDGSRIVSGSDDRTLKLWDSATARELVTLMHSSMVHTFAFSPDGSGIVSASADGLKLWNTLTGQELRTIFPRHYIASCAISPDGKLLVSAGRNSLLVWNLQTGEKLTTLPGRAYNVAGCAFSPDGSRIVSESASTDYTLRVWDTKTGQELLILAGHTNMIESCSFSHEGNLIASASWDKTLKVWDAKTGRRLMEYPLDGEGICLAWNASSSSLAVGCKGGALQILAIENIDLAPPVVTPARSSRKPETVFHCPFCRCWTTVTKNAVGTQVTCSDCGSQVQLNPFTIDADQPIVETWASKNDEQLKQGNEKRSRGDPEPGDSSATQLPYVAQESTSNEQLPGMEPSNQISVEIPQPHRAANPELATRLNIEHQKELARWKALSWWKRMITKKPNPPEGI